MAVIPVEEAFCTLGVTQKTRRKRWTECICYIVTNENLKKATAATHVSVSGWSRPRFYTAAEIVCLRLWG